MSGEQGGGTRPWIEGRPGSAEIQDRVRWFNAHYVQATNEILEFIENAGLSIDTRRVLDIGCGDGAIDLGLCHRANPARLLGLDLFPTNIDALKTVASAAGVEAWPKNLDFGTCMSTAIPLPDSSIDVVTSWSVFEHVDNPVQVLSELRRVIRPGGFMFMQIWPLYWSQHGSHLWFWYPDGWKHQLGNAQEICNDVRESKLQSADVTEEMLIDFRTLNRITVESLQRALAATGFRITRVQLQSDVIEIPRELAHVSIADLAISGVKLIAVPD